MSLIQLTLTQEIFLASRDLRFWGRIVSLTSLFPLSVFKPLFVKQHTLFSMALQLCFNFTAFEMQEIVELIKIRTESGSRVSQSVSNTKKLAVSLSGS